VRLLIWGESLGLVPPENGKKPRELAALQRSEIRSAIEASLFHLRNLLVKADVITGRYEAEAQEEKDSAAIQKTSNGMTIFRSKFDNLKARLK